MNELLCIIREITFTPTIGFWMAIQRKPNWNAMFGILWPFYGICFFGVNDSQISTSCHASDISLFWATLRFYLATVNSYKTKSGSGLK